MFNLIVLILVTIVFLMFGYLITHADIFSPFCVFCEMFLIAEFLCLFFVKDVQGRNSFEDYFSNCFRNDFIWNC